MKYLYLIICLGSFWASLSQTPTADELILVHNVADDAEMNSITPNEGAIIYNATTQRLYKYNGTQWVKVAIAPVVKEVTASYTLLPSDDGNIITVNSNAPVTLTIPSGFAIGYNVSVYQIGTGRVTFTGSGTSVLNRLNRFRTAGRHAGVGIVSTATNTFHLTGDLRR